MRLLRVEITRLLVRRIVIVLGLLVFGGLLLTNGVRFAQSSNDIAAARAQAERRFEEHRELVVRDIAESRRRFEAERRNNPQLPPEAGPPTVEEALSGLSVDNFFQDPRYHMRDVRGDLGAVGIVVAMLAFMAGTTFAGAEWAAGTMQSLLFWEPRRMRVMAAKLGAVAIVAVTAAAVAMLLQLGLSALTAEFRGTFAGTSSAFWSELTWRGVRIALLAPLTGLFAFGIAGLTRHTAAALGVGFVYFAVLETLVRGLRPGWSRYLVSNQFVAWVEKRFELPETAHVGNGTAVIEGPGFGFPEPFVLTMNRAGLTLAIYLAIVLTAMTVSFVRRDVT